MATMPLIGFSLSIVPSVGHILIGRHCSDEIKNIAQKLFCVEAIDSIALGRYMFSYCVPHTMSYLVGLALAGIKVPIIALVAAVALTILCITFVSFIINKHKTDKMPTYLKFALAITVFSCIQGFFWGSNMNVLVKTSLIRSRQLVTYLNLGPKIYKSVDQFAFLFKAAVIVGRIVPSYGIYKVVHYTSCKVKECNVFELK